MTAKVSLYRQTLDGESPRWIEELTANNILARVGMLNDMANTILSARDPLVEPAPAGQRWHQDFLACHPSLAVKFSRALDHARAVAITKPLIEDWSNLWQRTMEDYSITLDNVYNIDETGIMMGVLGRSLVVIPGSDTGKRAGSNRQRQEGHHDAKCVFKMI